MSEVAVTVLLLGEGAKSSAHLIWQLEQWGCRCWCATSSDEGLRLLHQQKFHLVLSLSRLRQATRILNSLERSKSSVFHAERVEQGCWWLPLMRNGKQCMGAPALRPKEFVGVLDEILKEVRSAYISVPKRSEGALAAQWSPEMDPTREYVHENRASNR